jgi:hypothetical protein
MLLPGTFVNSIARGGVARDHRLAIVAILIFISLYKDHQKQFRDTCIKNEKVWGMIQEQLSTNGIRKNSNRK